MSFCRSDWRVIRPQILGRDWFDFLWYIRRSTLPNLAHLQDALEQAGPFSGQGLDLSGDWLEQALTAKIASLDWPEAVRDVEPFLNPVERRSLAVWGAPLFNERARKLCDLLR